jgi:hypothetical protein
MVVKVYGQSMPDSEDRTRRAIDSRGVVTDKGRTGVITDRLQA